MTSMPCMSKSFSPFSFLINVITCTVHLWLSNSRLSELLKLATVHMQLINFKMAAIIIIIFVSVFTTLCYGLFNVEQKGKNAALLVECIHVLPGSCYSDRMPRALSTSVTGHH